MGDATTTANPIWKKTSENLLKFAGLVSRRHDPPRYDFLFVTRKGG